jgi:dCMP deaminase
MNKFRKWDERFLDLAFHIAQWSKDSSTKVGCVVVSPDRRIISTGYNGLPRGVDDDVQTYPGRHERPEKYAWYEHAERNAIYNAAALGVPVRDCTLYSTLQPCSDCARGIIQSGVAALVFSEDTNKERVARMAEDHKRATLMMREAKLIIRVLQRTYPLPSKVSP